MAKRLIVLTQIQIADITTPDEMNRMIVTSNVLEMLLQTGMYEVMAAVQSQSFFDIRYAQIWRYQSNGMMLKPGDVVVRGLTGGYTLSGTDEKVYCEVKKPNEKTLTLINGKYREFTNGYIIHPFIEQHKSIRYVSYEKVEQNIKSKSLEYLHAGGVPFGHGKPTPIIDLCGYAVDVGGVWSEMLVTGKMVQTEAIRNRLILPVNHTVTMMTRPYKRSILQTATKGISLINWGMSDGPDSQKVWEYEGKYRWSYSIPHWTTPCLHPPRYNPVYAGGEKKSRGPFDFWGANHLVVYNGEYMKRPDGFPLCTALVPGHPPKISSMGGRGVVVDIEFPMDMEQAVMRTYLPCSYETSEAWLEVHVFGYVDELDESDWILRAIKLML